MTPSIWSIEMQLHLPFSFFFCVLFLSNPQDVGFCASAACEGGGPIEPVACKLLFKKLTSTPHLPFGLLPPNVAGHKRRGGSSRKSFHLLRLHLHSTSVLLFFLSFYSAHRLLVAPFIPFCHADTWNLTMLAEMHLPEQKKRTKITQFFFILLLLRRTPTIEKKRPRPASAY